MQNTHSHRSLAGARSLVAVLLLGLSTALSSACIRSAAPGSPVLEPAPPLQEGKEPGDAGSATVDTALETARREAREAAQMAAAAEKKKAEEQVAPVPPVVPGDLVLEREAIEMLDSWHAAAAVGDRARYLGHFTKDAVFLGTDRTERWDLATFSAYVEENFRPGRGWKYTPFNRHVLLAESRDVAWFDELLDSNGYGDLRGTGVLRREEAKWKIVHYSMTYTVPNGIAGEVVEIVRQAGG